PRVEVEGGVLRAGAADVGLGVDLGPEIEPAVEQHFPRGMHDQVGGDRHGDPAFGRFEQEAVRDGQEAAGVGVELGAHGALRGVVTSETPVGATSRPARVKSYEETPAGRGRYSPPRIVSVEKDEKIGYPDLDLVSTSMVERQ